MGIRDGNPLLMSQRPFVITAFATDTTKMQKCSAKVALTTYRPDSLGNLFEGESSPRAKWHLDWFFSEHLGFPLTIIIPRVPLAHLIFWAGTAASF
jgi:hypothetical protein